jgi:3-dehydroquinate synthase
VLVTSPLLSSKLSWAIKELNIIIPSIKIVRVPNGEKAKEWDILKQLLSSFSKNELARNALVLGLGGGSITDLVGFASSIYLRGIDYINIPTTLLAQVDSSIGGKTAINFANYKNQIGSFYDPLATVIDVRFLSTLSKEQWIDGLAEIIKVGFVKDSTIIQIIRSNKFANLAHSNTIKTLIDRSINVKEYYVKKDAKDIGVRQVLNFGHTIGHAIELKYKLSHGQSVLIGMAAELKIGELLGKTKPETRSEYMEILNNLGINLNDKPLKIDFKYVLHDKKVLGNMITLPIIKSIGKVELQQVSLDKLAKLLQNNLLS